MTGNPVYCLKCALLFIHPMHMEIVLELNYLFLSIFFCYSRLWTLDRILCCLKAMTIWEGKSLMQLYLMDLSCILIYRFLYINDDLFELNREVNFRLLTNEVWHHCVVISVDKVLSVSCLIGVPPCPLPASLPLPPSVPSPHPTGNFMHR